MAPLERVGRAASQACADSPGDRICCTSSIQPHPAVVRPLSQVGLVDRLIATDALRCRRADRPMSHRGLAFADPKDEPKPDAWPFVVAYGALMADRFERTLGKYASVTVEAAARLVGVDVARIRHWSEVGSLEIQRRGDMDVVRFDQVRALATAARMGTEGSGAGSLRALLRDTPRIESVSVSLLQELAREKAGIPS